MDRTCCREKIVVQFSENEIKILGEYRFVGGELLKLGRNRKENPYLLCVRQDPNGSSYLDRISTRDATCWEIFKSYFGLGKLAHCRFSLKDVAEYLSQRELSSLSLDSSAYQTVHGIASRTIVHRNGNGLGLWSKLSTKSMEFKVRRIVRERSGWKKDSDTVLSSARRTLFITPRSRIGHLIAQVEALESRDGSFPTEALQWGKKNPCTRYYRMDPENEANDENLKELFFNIVERVSHEFPNNQYCVYN